MGWGRQWSLDRRDVKDMRKKGMGQREVKLREEQERSQVKLENEERREFRGETLHRR
jgi:hypothetical protein